MSVLQLKLLTNSIGKDVIISGAAMSGEKEKQISDALVNTQIIYRTITTHIGKAATLVVQSEP